MPSLLGTSNLNTAALNGLLSTITGVLASMPVIGPMTQPLTNLAGALSGVLTPAGGGGTTPAATPAPTPAATATAMPKGLTTLLAAIANFSGYRASIGAITVNKARSSAKFDVSCPANAPKGCLVRVTGAVAGQAAIPSLMLALPRGASTPVTVKLNKSTTRNLRDKGGAVSFKVETAKSSLAADTQIVKVKRLKKA
jgi:hypothetical protein